MSINDETKTIEIGIDETGNKIKITTKDVKRHIFISGSTGSGKSVLFRKIIEEAAINAIPSIVFDLQGDISRLLITLPQENLPEEFREKLERFKQKVEPIVLIPGGNINPINLGPFSIILKDVQDEEELDELAYQKGLEVAQLIPSIQDNKRQAITTYLYYLFKKAIEYNYEIDQPGKLIKALNISTFIPEASKAKLTKNDKDKLITTLQHLQIGPLEKIYGKGEPFNLNKLIKETEKTRILIINLTALPDEETKKQIIANTLRRIFTWAYKNPSPELQIIVGIDELFGIAPPREQTPPKEPLIQMATKGRKYGIGLILSTQKPVHIDHKIVGECNTSFIGKHQGRNDWDHLSSMIKTSEKLNHQEIKNKLPELKTGEFLFLGINYPPMFIKVIPGITDYKGAPMSIEEIQKTTPIIIQKEKQAQKKQQNKKIIDKEKTIKQKIDRESKLDIKKTNNKQQNEQKNKNLDAGLKEKIRISKIRYTQAIKAQKRLPEVLKEKIPKAKIKTIKDEKIYLFSPSLIIRPKINQKERLEEIKDILLKRDYFILTTDENSEKALPILEKHIRQFIKTKVRTEIEINAPEKVLNHIEQYTRKTINSLLIQEKEINKIIIDKIEEIYPDTHLKQLELEFELYLEKAEEYTKKVKEYKLSINALKKQYQLVKTKSRKSQLQNRINNLELLIEKNEQEAKKLLEIAKKLKERLIEEKNKPLTHDYDLIIKRALIEIPIQYVYTVINGAILPIIWIPSIGEIKIPCAECIKQNIPWNEAFTDDLINCEKCGKPLCKVHRIIKKPLLGGKEKIFCHECA